MLKISVSISKRKSAVPCKDPAVNAVHEYSLFNHKLIKALSEHV
jgi:hypothetical protein